MKKLLIVLNLLLLSSILTAQNRTKSIEISREDYSLIKITDSERNYTIKSKEKSLNDNQLHYEITKGKGGEKDQSGIRERRKQYLISSEQDTLATITNKGKQIQINNTLISRNNTPDGWVYLDDNNDTLYTANLLWNNSKWKYNLTSYSSDEIGQSLDKIIFLSMVDMAQARSKINCDDDSFSGLWYILYVGSLYKN